MFYDRFIGLCKARGVSPSAVMVSIGLNKSNATFWKKGSIPKGDTLQKLADYFGVSVDYLLGTEKEPFEVGETFLGGRLLVTKVENNGDGTLNVSFSVNNNGMTADELTQILETIEKMSKETRVPIADMAQFTEAMNKAIQSAVVRGITQAALSRPQERAETTPESSPPSAEGNDTTPAPDAPETPPEGE